MESDTHITEETETDFAMISEQTLNGNADFQNICDFSIPTQSYPDDLD